MMRKVLALLVTYLLTPLVALVFGTVVGRSPIVGLLAALASVATIIWLGLDIFMIIRGLKG
jgi:p-aminobenzoyl-glutamate transporter AbgT